GVQDLVLDELVLVAEAVLVEHPVIVQDDGVVHRAAQGQVPLAQELDVLHEAEGTGPADLLDEGGGGEVDLGAGGRLVEDRVVEVDREADLEALEGLEAGPLVAVLDLDRLLDADEALGL